jgi:ribosomal protein L16/L10AE
VYCTPDQSLDCARVAIAQRLLRRSARFCIRVFPSHYSTAILHFDRADRTVVLITDL